MATVTNINEVLDGHVALEVECVDRLYLNAYVPNLQVGGQVNRFLEDHLGQRIGSPAIIEKIGNRFRREVKAFAARNRIPIMALKKPDRSRWDDRKLDHVRPWMEAAERAGRYGVVAIVSAQEFQWVFSGTRRTGGGGGVFFEWSKAERRVGTYYFYVLDPEFGPGFRALRIETVINKPADIGVLARIEHLPELVTKARGVNGRLLMLERAGQGCAIGSALFERIHQPYKGKGQRTGALRFGDPRAMALTGALVLFVHAVAGFTNKSLRGLVAGLLGRDYTTNQMTYDLRRLRLHGLVERIPHTNTYTLTPDGVKVAVFYTKVHGACPAARGRRRGPTPRSHRASSRPGDHRPHHRRIRRSRANHPCRVKLAEMLKVPTPKHS